jgi:uncharacterized membrane protein YphA (DoxX/SURF4 family)
MQRLYSTFPNSLPGVGLLLIRATIGVPMLMGKCPLCGIWHAQFVGYAGGVVVATLLLAGLWTPIAAAALAALAMWAMLCAQSLSVNQMVIALVAIGVAMLGPGAWSLDSILFGRKRIIVIRQTDRHSDRF